MKGGVKMIDWRNEILSRLSTAEWKPLEIISWRFPDLEDKKKIKDTVLLLEKEGLILLYPWTPEDSVDKGNSEDLKYFFNLGARLKKIRKNESK